MFEVQFQQLLTEYIDALPNRSRFVGLVKDFFPGQQMKINLLVTAYDIGLCKAIETASSIDNVFAFRFVKRLMDEYGISRMNADWAVSIWCVCYGKNVLHKPCEIKIQGQKASSVTPAIENEKKGSIAYGDLFLYERLQNGTYAVVGFQGDNDRTLIFPNRYQNTEVTVIKANAFVESNVREAILTEGYTAIGEKAFQGCTLLKQFIFPESLKVMGDFALEGCENLSTVVLPMNLEQIGAFAFCNTNIKTVDIPKTVYWIGEGAFSNCNSITKILIPRNIRDLPTSLFKGCKNLRKVEFQDTLSSIGNSAFAGCSSLETIYIPDSVVSIGDDAFTETNEKFILECSFGSYAEAYARQKKLRYQFV